MKIVNMVIIYALNKLSSVKHYIEDNMNESFFKVTKISDGDKLSNICIKLPKNIICIRTSAISRLIIFLDICVVNMWHPNIYSAIRW